MTVDELSKRPDLPVVDVREPDEYAAGHVPGARNVPLGTVRGRAAELAASGAFAVICQSGGRSAHAVEVLAAAGADAVNVDGGTAAWAASGREVES